MDGLRAFAAIGVVWVHCWSYSGNMSFTVYSVDINRLISFVGSGVDFFFVISGFCMYLIWHEKEISTKQYFNFIIKRFRRIAPAFYVSALVYLLIKSKFYSFTLLFFKFFINALFLNNIFPDSEIIGPFWSLGTEWHFYIVLPFLFLTISSVVKRVYLLMALSILFACLVYKGYFDLSFWHPQIMIRFVEFGWGIIAARYYKSNIKMPLLKGYAGLFLGFSLLYLGRLLKVTEVLKMAGHYQWILNAFAEPLMTFGFAWILYLVITEKTLVSQLLDSFLFRYLGKISYSIYLWHSLVIMLLIYLPFIKAFHNSVSLIFIVVLPITILLSAISYKFLELHYFKARKLDSNSFEK